MTQQEAFETMDEAINMADKNGNIGLGSKLFEIELTLKSLWGIEEDN